MYCDIARSGDYNLVAIKPGQKPEDCYLAWEEIVKRNSDVNGSFEYNTTFNLVQSYALLVNDYNMVKACLLKLYFKVDNETIEYLKTKGYHINTSGRVAYKESLENAMRNSDNLITKYTRKQKELFTMHEKETEVKPVGFEELLAGLSAELKFPIDESITLARFNEYKKIIKNRQKPEKSI